VEPSAEPLFEVAIVGGGPAGLAAALVLGRMQRRVLVLDADEPAHAVSDAVHGFFGHDGIPPRELRRIAREQLGPYESVTVQMTAADDVSSTAGGFAIRAGGTTSRAGVLLLCTGLRYELPPLEGLEPLWCRGVYHCPYCHGWEVRDRPLAAYGTKAASLALLSTSLSDDVVLLTDGSRDLDPQEAELLGSAGVHIRDDSVARVEGEGGNNVRVVFADGSTDDRAAVFLVPTTTPSPLAGRLGCDQDQSGQVITDEDGRRSIPGVFAAGDTTADRKAVVLAAAAGSRAAYVINAGLARGLLPPSGPGPQAHG
jgi:thioredoxin reductase